MGRTYCGGAGASAVRFCDDAFSRLSRLSGVVAPVVGVCACRLSAEIFAGVDMLLLNYPRVRDFMVKDCNVGALQFRGL